MYLRENLANALLWVSTDRNGIPMRWNDPEELGRLEFSTDADEFREIQACIAALERGETYSVDEVRQAMLDRAGRTDPGKASVARPTLRSMAHAIDYIEIAVDDIAAAKDFYAKALGWAFTDYGPEYAGIQDPRNPGGEFGGLTQEPANRGNGVTALMSTDDADAALTSVTAAGGTVVAPLHDYPGGRRFTFADPSGNVLGVYQSSH